MAVKRTRSIQTAQLCAALQTLICLCTLFVMPYSAAAEIIEDAHRSVDQHANNFPPSDSILGSGGSNSHETIDYCLQLHAGTNLISFYALPADTSVSNVMESLLGNATSITAESAAAQYDETAGWVGNINSISPRSGYWVTLKNDDSLCLNDAIPTDPNMAYELHVGRNLISFPFQGTMDIGDALPDQFESITTEIIGEGIAASNTGGEGWIGSLTDFEGGKGYWITVTEPTVLVYDIPSPSSMLAMGFGIVVVLGLRSCRKQART